MHPSWARRRAIQKERKLTNQPNEGNDLAPLNKDETGGENLLPLIQNSLNDDMAQDVVTIDLAGKSSIADAMIVCSGRSQRHVGAIADHLLRVLKETGRGRVQVEGMPHCDWVLIDAGDVVVHIFRPEVRDFYRLERMWSVELPSEAAV